MGEVCRSVGVKIITRKSLAPDLEAELRFALGRPPADLERDLASALRDPAKRSPGLLLALANALSGADDKLAARITRKGQMGRPSGKVDHEVSPLELESFVQEALLRGILMKNIVADAKEEFEISRATFYRLRGEAKRMLEEAAKLEALRSELLTPGRAKGGVKGERSLSRQKRKKVGKSARALAKIALPSGEWERIRRSQKRGSQKTEN